MEVDKIGFLNMKVIFLEILVTIISILISCFMPVSIHYELSIVWQKYALLEKKTPHCVAYNALTNDFLLIKSFQI